MPPQADGQVLPQYLAGIVSALGSFALGTVIGWSSPVEIGIKRGDLGFAVSDQQFAWVGSLMTLGAACVCLPIGYVIDVIGRKRSMVALVPPFVLGWLLIIFAQNIEMLCVARFLLGMCGGAFCIIAPIYTTEIAETRIRGILGSMFQMLITMGVQYGYVVGSLCPVVTASVLCGIVPVVMGCLFLALPESPAFHVRKGRTELAARSLQWLRGRQYDITADVAQLLAADRQRREKSASLLRALFTRPSLKALGLSISLMLFQQLSGINAIVFYATSMFKDANPEFSETMSTMLMGLLMVVTTFLSLFLIDRAGRRILLILSASFMTLCSLGIGYYFIQKSADPEAAKSIAWLPVSCSCVYVIMFSAGFGAIPWLVMAEIFSEDLKGFCGAIAGTTNWAMAFLVTNLYPLVSGVIGVGETFCVFAAISLAAVIFVLLLLPETKNKSFADIQLMLGAERRRSLL